MAVKYMIGVDEVGRGPLAGPLAVAAVQLKVKNKKEKVRAKLFLRGIKDSKQLSEKQRQEWFDRLNILRARGLLEYRVSFISPARIDREGLSRVTRVAVARALTGLSGEPLQSKVLLDGLLYAPRAYVFQETIIGGDTKEPLIAAASIIAKVLRDRRMTRYAARFPEYGFDMHKGYGTQIHRQAILLNGSTPLHRESFLGKIWAR